MSSNSSLSNEVDLGLVQESDKELNKEEEEAATSLSDSTLLYMINNPLISEYIFQSKEASGNMHQLPRIIPLLCVIREKMGWPAINEVDAFDEYKPQVSANPLLQQIHQSSFEQLRELLYASTITLIQIMVIQLMRISIDEEDKNSIIQGIVKYMVDPAKSKLIETEISTADVSVVVSPDDLSTL